MMILLLIIIVLVCLLFVFYYLQSSKIVEMLARPKMYSLEQSMQKVASEGYLDFFNSMPQEEFFVKTPDEYSLYCIFSPQKDFEKNKKIVVISHGHRGMRLMSVKYANLYYKLGYSTVIYDLRGHGNNLPHFVSMGYNESKDLACVVEYLYQKYGSDIQIGLHGESMGSATSILALDYLKDRDINFCVADCSYSSIKDFVKILTKKAKKFPQPIFALINTINKKKYGYDLNTVRPYITLENSTVPILLIHGEEDRLIDCWHSKKLFKHSIAPNKQISIFPRADHASSIRTNPKDYERVVTDFLNR